jgi:hypothetical protein
MKELNNAHKIIDSALEALKKRVGIVEPRFTKFVLEWVTKFDTSSGNIGKSEGNKERLTAFKRAVERFLIQSGYGTLVDKFVVNFDELQENQQRVQSSLNGIDLPKSFLNPFKTWAVENTLANMTGQGLSLALIKPIENELFTSVYQGGSLKDLITSLELQLNGTDQRSGTMTRLITQAGRDALGQYNGVVNEAVRKTYKMDGILYVGSIVKDSRAQCERWVDIVTNGQSGLIPFEDLDKEIKWANNYGGGFIKDTTPETFCQNRGGYNCRHDAYPVRLDSFK